MARERAGGEAPAPTSTNTLNIAEIRQLIALMNGGDIEEITVEQQQSSLKLTLRKPAPLFYAAELASADAAEPEAEPEPVDHTLTISAHLVGVFRSSMKPGVKPLIAGDVVREGQIIGAIEALNVLNEVEASRAGRIRDVLASDGQPVEYGQPLLVIE